MATYNSKCYLAFVGVWGCHLFIKYICSRKYNYIFTPSGMLTMNICRNASVSWQKILHLGGGVKDEPNKNKTTVIGTYYKTVGGLPIFMFMY